jgi:hypothetical protein
MTDSCLEAGETGLGFLYVNAVDTTQRSTPLPEAATYGQGRVVVALLIS